MGDDIVEHLSTVDILEEHVPMKICTINVSHATYVRMVNETNNGGFASSPDFFGVICSFSFCSGTVFICRLTGYNFDGNL
jgi:hypothetical protein